MKYWFILLVFVLGCGHKHIIDEPSSRSNNEGFHVPKEKAVIYFFRSMENIGFKSEKKYQVELDGNSPRDLARFEYYSEVVDVGNHHVKIHSICNDEEYTIAAEAGRLYFIGERDVTDKGQRLGSAHIGMLGGGCIQRERMKIFEETAGKIEVQKCSRNNK